MTLDRTDPPAGTVQQIHTSGPPTPEPQIAFSGWLGLLGALSELIGSPDEGLADSG